MTIVAGFLCHEGLLLASDTLYTGTNKRYGQKLWLHESGGNAIGFGGAGTQQGLERVQYEIGRHLQPRHSEEEIIEVIEGALTTALEALQPQQDETTAGLFVIRRGGTLRFFENYWGGTGISPVGHFAQCVGSGAALGQYIIDYLYREVMPVKWARLVAAHLIRLAKKHSGLCGGDTQFLQINRDGTHTLITDQEVIREDERHLEQLEGAMRAVLPDGTANEYTLALRLSTIVTAIEKASKSLVIPIDTGGFETRSGSSNVISSELPTPRIHYGRPPEEK